MDLPGSHKNSRNERIERINRDPRFRGGGVGDPWGPPEQDNLIVTLGNQIQL